MQDFLDLAIHAAREAGESLRQNFNQPLQVNEAAAHDIKLELDVQTQALITRILLERFPTHALYGEEGITGDQSAEYQWIVDPIDGTVNYFYRIPHFCISIALRRGEDIIVGVIYDPMRNELWATRAGEQSTLNGVPFRVSARTELSDAVVSVGFSKSDATITAALPLLTDMVRRVRKCRMQGSAALDMAYVACGRFDAYIEHMISLWDVAAGILLVQNAGGAVDLRPRPDAKDKFSIVAWNAVMDLQLPARS
ncbi:MAG TPA: inositol monophosphatase family protein [Chthoniobacterales bacterium]